MLAVGFAEIAALVPLGTVLGFAALLLKRWWTQQDNAMAAAIDASNKEGVKCDERIAALKLDFERDMAAMRRDHEKLRTVVRDMMPVVPTEAQARLWDVLWSNNDVSSSSS